MKARTHDLAAITAFGVMVLSQPSKTMSLATVLVAVLANQLGGIAPDIDQPVAPFWRNLPIGGFFGRVIGKMMGGHRFITHSILGLVLFGFGVRALLAFLHPIMPNIDADFVWWAFMIGMLSHLVMDTITKEGVPWLLPLPIKFGFPPIKAMRVTTGKLGEGIVFVVILLFDILYFGINYSAILDLIHKRIV
ncbi:MAG TPA: metal-dependent hydrolase [Candidatus Saccharimonadales bacterium]|nr:metal-dependent hydrolase [Candidatus Saccharimonadales bacterium]